MFRRRRSLLATIERDALRSDRPIADVLRTVVALGNQAGSAELRDWAIRELKGYVEPEVPLPDYRQPAAILQVDAVQGGLHVTDYQIGRNALPDGVRESIDEVVPLGQGVGELEAMARRARAEGGKLKIALPGSQIVVQLMNLERTDPTSTILAVYCQGRSKSAPPAPVEKWPTACPVRRLFAQRAVGELTQRSRRCPVGARVRPDR